MATNKYGNAFKTAINRGTPASQAVANIANNFKKTETFIWNELFKSGYANRRRFNGSWIYWPAFSPSRKNTGNFRNWSWQQIINWAIQSGYCTPMQVANLKTQKDFFNFFGPFFQQQFGWTVKSGWTTSQVNRFGASKNGSAKKTSKRRTRKTTKRAKAKSTKKSTASRKRNVKKNTTAKRRARTTAKRRVKRSTTAKRTVRKATKRRSATKARRNTKSSVKRNTKTSAKRTTKSPAKRRTKNVRRNKVRLTTASPNYIFRSHTSGQKTYRRAA